MTSTTDYPDHLAPLVLVGIEGQVSAEIAFTEVTAGYLDGTARQRRDLRILARRLNGITARFGVTLEEAIKQSQGTARPMVVKLTVVESAFEPVAVDTPTKNAVKSAPAVEPPAAAVSSPVVCTVRGHHFAFSDPRNETGDHVCRSCGASGPYGYVLDRARCTAPAPYVGIESLGQVA
jgi:hypothetical protein